MARSFRILFFVLFFSGTMSLCAKETSVFYAGADGKPGKGRHVVLVSGDEEYRSEEMCVQLARILATRHGFDCTVLFAINKETGFIDPDTQDNIPGLDVLEKADMAVFFLRFRNLPDEQMKYIDDYLLSGRPVLGIRPSVAAFRIPRDRIYARYSFDHNVEGPWQGGFGRVVLGETWIAHHGRHQVEGTRGIVAENQRPNPIVRGCEDIFGPTDVYTIRLPLPEGRTPLVYGQVLAGLKPDDKPVEGPKNNPAMPLAWIGAYRLPEGKEGTAFTTTMGCSQDFESEGFRRLLVNAVYRLTGLGDMIPDRADVAIVGRFEPTPYGFQLFRKNLTPQDVK